MSLANYLACAGVTLMVSFTVPLAWGQATEPGLAGSTPAAPAAVFPTVPAERVAPGVPGIPPNAPRPLGTFPTKSRVDAMKADDSAKSIVNAQGRSTNLTTTGSREVAGKPQSKNELRDEATPHFDPALGSVGLMPVGLNQDAGERNSASR
jgi:hypothetical protein